MADKPSVDKKDRPKPTVKDQVDHKDPKEHKDQNDRKFGNVSWPYAPNL